jgi:hypothetical protein
MKHAIETGTDAAIICFFDPAALPAGFGERNPADDWSKIGTEGRIWFEETEIDGGFLFHFYIDEEMPERIRKYSVHRTTIENFMVPGGAIWACGGEFAGRNPLKKVKGRKQRGGEFALPPGNYRTAVWTVEWPDDFEQQEKVRRLGKAYVNLFNWHGLITSLLFLASLIATLVAVSVTLSSLYGSPRRNLLLVWAVAVMAWLICLPVMRFLTRVENDPRIKEISLEFPSIVVEMKRLS